MTRTEQVEFDSMKECTTHSVTAMLLVLMLIGCSGLATDREGWVHETSTNGSVTTVRTLSGSVWGGSARLVEEALFLSLHAC